MTRRVEVGSPTKTGDPGSVQQVLVRLADREGRPRNRQDLRLGVRSQWLGKSGTETIAERAEGTDSSAVALIDLLADLGADPALGNGVKEAWLETQLAAEATMTGSLLGVRIALAPENRKWRVYVVVPLLGWAFPSGKVNETPSGAMGSAAARFRRRLRSERAV